MSMITALPAAPCVACGTTGGYISVGHRKTPDRVRGLCNRCKARELRTGAIWDRPLSTRQREPTAADLPAMIAAKARAITADEIAERCAEAALELAEANMDALIWGDFWRERHPERFTPEAIAALYPDPAGLAFSAWAEDTAAQRAA